MFLNQRVSFFRKGVPLFPVLPPLEQNVWLRPLKYVFRKQSPTCFIFFSTTTFFGFEKTHDYEGSNTVI